MTHQPASHPAPLPAVWVWTVFRHDCARDYRRFCLDLAPGLEPAAALGSEAAFGLSLWRDVLMAYGDALAGFADLAWSPQPEAESPSPRTSALVPLPE